MKKIPDGILLIPHLGSKVKNTNKNQNPLIIVAHPSMPQQLTVTVKVFRCTTKYPTLILKIIIIYYYKGIVFPF